MKHHLSISPQHAKRGSNKPDFQGALASGLNRRAFLKTTGAIAALGGLLSCKPNIPRVDTSKIPASAKTVTIDVLFTAPQSELLDAIYMQLFPADGNGPSARDINAVKYLEWAMSDPDNIDDGDPEFIIKGLGWLEDLAQQTQGDAFIGLTQVKQQQVLTQIAQSRAGENWMSLLIYYLTEALLLDPVYGGNPEQVGWQWLEHQPGFPRPVVGKTYRDFSK